MMKKFISTILFAVLGCNFSYAQHDSLELVVKTTADDTVRVNALKALSWESIDNSDLDLALSYAQQAMKTASEAKHVTPRWRRSMEASLYDVLGVIHWYKSDLNRALEFYFKGLAIHEELGEKEKMAGSYNNIGNIQHSKGDLDKALELYLKALVIFEEFKDHANGKSRLAYACNNVGIILSAKGESDKALGYYSKALQLREEIGDKRGMADTYNSIGVEYHRKNDLDKSLEIFFKSFGLREVIDDKQGMLISCVNIGSVYIDQKKFSEGKRYLLNSLSMAKSIGYKNGIKEAYLSLSQCDSALGDFKGAYDYHKQYSFYKDSIFNAANAKTMAEIQERYESERKDKELIRKDAELQKQNAESERRAMERNGFIIGFALMLTLAFFIFRSYRQKQNANVEISKQKAIIEDKQKEIVDSIQVAKRIQQSLLPTDRYIERNLERLKKNQK